MVRWMGKVLSALVPLVVLSAAGAAVAFLFASAPTVERTPPKRLLPLVEVVPVERTALDRVVEAYGTVTPAREVQIYPEVSGRILSIHPAMEPGGVITEGETLVEIDPEEYELALERAQGALAEAEAALDVEQGQQLVAKREWEMYGKDLPNAEMGRALALREPQLRQAEALIQTAKSGVKEAELNLRRTRITAPFDVLVLEESVDIGQYVTPGKSVASLAGSDNFWVNVSVPASRLEAVRQAAESGRETVLVYSEVEGLRQKPIPGRLVRHLGRVDPDGRMAQVLVEVDDPLRLDVEKPAHPTLALNTYVRVEIPAGALSNTVVMPRRAYRENEEVWVIDRENRLQIRRVDIIWRQGERLAVEDVFEPGERIVVSPVGDLLPNMQVRTPEKEGDTKRAPEVAAQ